LFLFCCSLLPFFVCDESSERTFGFIAFLILLFGIRNIVLVCSIVKQEIQKRAYSYLAMPYAMLLYEDFDMSEHL
jgi:hypothetical protein